MYARIAHPVVWIGKLIETLELRWNSPARSVATRRALGILTMLIVAGTAGAVGYAIQIGARQLPFGMIIVVLVATLGLAQRSLYSHVRDVLRRLAGDDLCAARAAVSKIVGRDTAQLTSSGVSAAAVESLAESFNDGIVAPAFWLAVGGLPGLFAYKALNTADSHDRSPRAALARIRLGGCARRRRRESHSRAPRRTPDRPCGRWRIARDVARRASSHASPNAGWPEAAMAGALEVAPRRPGDLRRRDARAPGVR